MRILLRAGNSPFRPLPAAAKGPGFGNSGNILFAHSVFKGLAKPGNSIDVDEYTPDFADPGEIHERYDAYVLPMANAFRPQFVSQLERYTALIRQLKIPCVVVGAGVQASLDLSELAGAPIDEPVKAFVSAILDRSPAIGVRGEHTRRYLERLGFGAVEVIGCPSMFFHGPALRVCQPHGVLTATAKIAVNHAPGGGAAFATFARQILARYSNSVFVAQEQANADTWKTVLSEPIPESAASRVRFFRDIPSWLAFMADFAFSTGTRIHGNIAALLAGVPAMVVVHDARTEEIARYHGIPTVPVDAMGGDVDAQSLFAMADMSALNQSMAAKFAHYRAFLEKCRLDHAYDQLSFAAAPDRCIRVHPPTSTGDD